MTSPRSTGTASPAPANRVGWARIRAAVTEERAPLWTWLMLALSLWQVWPILTTEHLPFQDLPQHLAAIRVLREWLEHGSTVYFDVSLLRTQYLAYYLVAILLSYPLGIVLANKLLLCAALVALPWSLFRLLRALGHDTRLSVFAFALTYNAHLILGFVNFLAAIPLVFFGLAYAIELRTDPSLKRQSLFALLLLACFYTHIVPFAFLALGAGLLVCTQGIVPTLRRAYGFIPAGGATLLWLISAPAGQSVSSAVRGNTGPQASYATTETALHELPLWLTDVLHGERDEQLLKAWAATFCVAWLLGLLLGWFARARGHEPAQARLGLRLVPLSPLAALAYFVAPTGYDWIWPISARFPLLALLLAIPIMPRQRGFLGASVLATAALLSGLSFDLAGRALAAFDRDEVGELDAALAVIPAEQRVAGLIFDRGSQHVKFSPFLHAVALYQVQKGGAVMFTFADFPQSPFSFKADARPPRVPPRWEWMPERVNPDADLGWYDYVLVRGGPGRIQYAYTFENVFRGPRWSVWRQR